MASNLSAKIILEDFLYEIALVSDTDNLNSTDDKITLMSLHASKGLEYDNVYLTGMNEGIFPSYQSLISDDSNEIEEERRLCYVGVTRAKKQLFLTCARRRIHNGAYNSYTESRFIDEIDNSLLEKHELSNNNIFPFDDNNDFWSGRKTNYYGNRSFGRKSVKDIYSHTTNKTPKLIDDNRSVSHIDLKKSIDTYKMGANIEKALKLSYDVGDRVSHVKFGDGQVIKIEDIGRDYEVTVNFDEIGEKTLFAAFAKLEKI